MSRSHRSTLVRGASVLLLGVAVAGSAGCATAPGGTPAGDAAVAWDAVCAWEGDAAIEKIRAGRPDPADPALQLIAVDQAGTVVHVGFAGGTPRSEVVYRHGVELTGIAVGDVDPGVPGEEVYVGGYAEGQGREGTGGAVVQIVLGPGGPRTRRVWQGDAYVHAMERVAPARTGEPVRLLVTTYAGEIRLLTPQPGDAPWEDRVVFRDTPSGDPEALKMKDVTLLRDASGRPPHVAMAAMKTGRVVVADLDDPASARLVHEEPGGLSRVSADAAGGAFLSGYFGRILHLVPDGAGFRADAIHHEAKDSGLRGASLGEFPVAGGPATLATFGFFGLCRVLTPRNGAWDATTLWRDTDRGHALEAADLIPGNGGDELALGGYSKRLTILVPRARR
jgi:hypothetical protein